MALVVGKQSNLNDLLALKAYLETQIEEAKAIKVGEVSQIESGTAVAGSKILSSRGNGVFNLGSNLVDSAAFGINGGSGDNGMSWQSQTNDNNCSAIFASWRGALHVGGRSSGLEYYFEALTTGNTITDANGFIKAA